MKELAQLLGGALGATRAAVDEGWISTQNLIGISGKIVAPKLYIGIALSGSSQHVSGMKGSKIIVAINKDPDAPIFRFAHYGVEGDYKKIIPSFFEAIEKFSSCTKAPKNEGVK